MRCVCVCPIRVATCKACCLPCIIACVKPHRHSPVLFSMCTQPRKLFNMIETILRFTLHLAALCFGRLEALNYIAKLPSQSNICCPILCGITVEQSVCIHRHAESLRHFVVRLVIIPFCLPWGAPRPIVHVCTKSGRRFAGPPGLPMPNEISHTKQHF